jgi:GntR family transcriptional regulator
MNIRVDTTSPVPPYEQVRSQIRAMVTGGVLAQGTRLPPIRQLAGDLGLAVNTVGRAYRELEVEGLIESRGRHGTAVRGASTSVSRRERRDMIEGAADRFAREAHHVGADLDEAMTALRTAWATIAHRPGTPGRLGTGSP